MAVLNTNVQFWGEEFFVRSISQAQPAGWQADTSYESTHGESAPSPHQ